jgi:anti-sigma regulatory factor (Ser/Thr protein kinase)
MNMTNEERPARPMEQLCLRVPADPRVGGYVRQEVMAFAELQGIAGADLVDFIAAIGEALANAIEHAHTVEPIEVSVWLFDDRLFASICDRGVGFLPNERTVAQQLPDAFAERGRGLPIMRRFVDIFSVRSAPGEGTRVTLACHVRRAA